MLQIITTQEYNDLKVKHTKKVRELSFIEQQLIDYERYQNRENISKSLQRGYKLNFETMQIEKDEKNENFINSNR